MMRNVLWLLAITASACAASQEQQNPLAGQRAQAEQLGAELHQSLAAVPAPPEPLTVPPQSAMEKLRTWSGFVLIGMDGDGPQAIALPIDDDFIITQRTIAESENLPRQSDEFGWRFTVPASIIFQAVLVSKDGHQVAGIIDLGADDPAYTGTEVLVNAYRQRPTSTRLCVRGVCGDIYKLVADTPIGCRGPRCADIFPSCAPQQGNSL